MRTLLEYAATDKFILLFLTSDKLAKSNRGNITVTRDSFDPDVMAMFDDSLGVPDMISCIDYKVNIDDDCNLHGSLEETEADKKFSFVATRFKLLWFGENNNFGPTKMHRDNGPASITLNNYKTLHHHGQRCGMSMNENTYRWYTNGQQRRSAGPYLLKLLPVDAIITTEGMLLTNNAPNFNMCDTMHWNHPSDNTNLLLSDIKRALQEGQIDINILSPTNSVFTDRLDEAAFYTTV